jgi:hypothetical protein
MIPAGIHHGVPMADYLGNTCPGPSVSRSGLWTIESKSPAHYWAESYLNPHRVPQEDTDALRLGAAVHTLILEPETWLAQHVVKPEGMTFTTKDGKAWRAEQEEAGRTILTPAEWRMVMGVEEAVKAHPLARRAIAESASEVTIAMQDAETGVWLKARPDALPHDPRRMPFSVQIKTTLDASPAAFSRSVWSYGYHLGAAIEIDMLAMLGWHDNPGYLLIAVEKEPPFAVTLVRLSDDAVGWGRTQYRRALRRFADCLAAGKWPAYSDAVTEVHLPEWAARGLERQLAAAAE